MDVKSRSKELLGEIKNSIKSLDLESLEQQKDELSKKSQNPTLWDNAEEARNIMKKLSDLQQTIDSWRTIEKETQELVELSELKDESLQSDLNAQLKKLEQTYLVLKKDLDFSGPYDSFDAILSIHAGAGGTDAQDWAQTLLRMYQRWSEANSYQAKILDESAGEEAGIKSASLLIGGRYAYGKLRGEHGVHRLVRLSPFNANNLRQTSFAKVEILPKIEKPENITLDEKDLKIDVFRAGGHGGQSVNTTDSAVRVTHLPTGITVSIQNERSQLQNKETAMTILRSKLAALQLEQHEESVAKIKGPNKSAEWGNQIRSYVMHPYTMVKDLRTRHETADVKSVLDGNLNDFIDAFLKSRSL